MQSRRSPRVRLSVQGSCKSARGFEWDIKVDDLSAGGCRVDDPRHGLELGAHIQLLIGDVGPYTAEVAWRQGDRVGLEFTTPLDPRVFQLMISDQWEEAREAEENGGKPAVPIRYPVRRIM